MTAIYRNKADGRVHYSDLKHMAISPSRYVKACLYPKPMSRAMTVGTVTDSLVFRNQKIAVYPGKVRNGKEWEAWRLANAGAVQCIQSELEDATEMADRVLRDPVAKRALSGCETQGVLQWEMHGLPFASGIKGVRGGFDAYSLRPMRDFCGFEDEYGPYTADLKACTIDGTLDEVHRHSLKMGWHIQGAMFGDAMLATGRPWQTHRVIVVCPTDVVVIRYTEAAIDAGRKSLALWCEQLRACEASGTYPGIAQDETECDAWQELDATGLE